MAGLQPLPKTPLDCDTADSSTSNAHLVRLPEEILELILGYLVPRAGNARQTWPASDVHSHNEDEYESLRFGDWRRTCKALRLTCKSLAYLPAILGPLYRRLSLIPTMQGFNELEALTRSHCASLVQELILHQTPKPKKSPRRTLQNYHWCLLMAGPEAEEPTNMTSEPSSVSETVADGNGQTEHTRTPKQIEESYKMLQAFDNSVNDFAALCCQSPNIMDSIFSRLPHLCSLHLSNRWLKGPRDTKPERSRIVRHWNQFFPGILLDDIPVAYNRSFSIRDSDPSFWQAAMRSCSQSMKNAANVIVDEGANTSMANLAGQIWQSHQHTRNIRVMWLKYDEYYHEKKPVLTRFPHLEELYLDYCSLQGTDEGLYEPFVAANFYPQLQVLSIKEAMLNTSSKIGMFLRTHSRLKYFRIEKAHMSGGWQTTWPSNWVPLLGALRASTGRLKHEIFCDHKLRDDDSVAVFSDLKAFLQGEGPWTATLAATFPSV